MPYWKRILKWISLGLFALLPSAFLFIAFCVAYDETTPYLSAKAGWYFPDLDKPSGFVICAVAMILIYLASLWGSKRWVFTHPDSSINHPPANRY